MLVPPPGTRVDLACGVTDGRWSRTGPELQEARRRLNAVSREAERAGAARQTRGARQRAVIAPMPRGG